MSDCVKSIFKNYKYGILYNIFIFFGRRGRRTSSSFAHLSSLISPFVLMFGRFWFVKLRLFLLEIVGRLVIMRGMSKLYKFELLHIMFCVFVLQKGSFPLLCILKLYIW